MDSGPEQVFDRLTQLAARLVGAPIALISLVDDRRQYFKSCLGLPEPWKTQRQTPLSHSFCQHIAVSGEPLVVADARQHPQLKENAAITELGVVAYLGFPLFHSGGQVLGSFCVIDLKPREWTDDEKATISDLAECVQTELELRRVLHEKQQQIQHLDITRRQLSRKAAQAHELSSRKSLFLAQLGHELRNPLSPLVHAVELLRSGSLGEDEKPEIYEMLNEQVHQVVRLVDDMLDLSRIEQGKIHIERERVDLVQLIHSVLRSADVLIRESQIELSREISEPQLTVMGDRDRLAQVVNNLISNACRYTHAGGHVRVKACREDGFAVLSVEDDGVGIEARDLQRVFDLFQQAGNREIEQRKSQDSKGLGLGLALVKQLVDLHGGRIDVTSEGQGKGAEFLIHLPLAPSSESDEDDSLEGSTIEALPAADMLIVEDTRAIAFMFRRLLESLGHQVRVASSAEEAWSMINESLPHLIFSDIEMPVTDGYQFASDLRRDPRTRGLPLIALTGNGDPEHVQRTTDAGFDYHLCKPIDIRTVSHVLHRFAAQLDAAK